MVCPLLPALPLGVNAVLCRSLCTGCQDNFKYAQGIRRSAFTPNDPLYLLEDVQCCALDGSTGTAGDWGVCKLQAAASPLCLISYCCCSCCCLQTTPTGGRPRCLAGRCALLATT